MIGAIGGRRGRRGRRGPSRAVRGRPGAVGGHRGRPAAIGDHRGHTGADGPRGTFHRPVLYVSQFNLFEVLSRFIYVSKLILCYFKIYFL